MRMREFVDGYEAPHLLLDWHWGDQVTAGVVLDLEALVNAIDAGGGSLRLCGLPERLRAAFEPALLDRLDVGESVPDALPRYVRELRDQAEANTGDSGCRISKTAFDVHSWRYVYFAVAFSAIAPCISSKHRGLMARKTKEESEETRRAILLAALDVLTEKGYSRTTFVDIARRIGMSKGAVYWHFKNKQALLAALMEEMRTREESLLAGETGAVTSLDGLKAYLVARLRIATRDELCRKFAFFMLLQMEWSVDVMEAVRRELMNIRMEPFDEFGPILNEARRRGELREDIDIATAKDMLKGMWIGLLTVYFQGLSATDPVQTAEIALGALIDSLRAQHR